MTERAILHSDANCFYASVETVLNPKLRGKAVAVCGLQEERHGIVLAKSEKAKKAGVKTGMAIWQAQQCCRDLIIAPPRYDYYLKFSKLLHGIYKRSEIPHSNSNCYCGGFFCLRWEIFLVGAAFFLNRHKKIFYFFRGIPLHGSVYWYETG